MPSPTIDLVGSVHLAMSMTDDDRRAKADLLFRQSRDDYDATLTDAIAEVGCSGKGRLMGGPELSALKERAAWAADSIVNTYNRDLLKTLEAAEARWIEEHGSREGLQRLWLAKQGREAMAQRAVWKEKQIAVTEQSFAADRAKLDFWRRNGIGGEVRVIPFAAVCPICKAYVAKGWLPMAQAQDEFVLPAHVSCPHGLELRPDKLTVPPCEELWRGQTVSAREGLAEVARALEHYGPGPHPGTGTEQTVHGKGKGVAKPSPASLASLTRGKSSGAPAHAYLGSEEARAELARITADELDPDRVEWEKEMARVTAEIRDGEQEAGRLWAEFEQYEKTGQHERDDEFLERMNQMGEKGVKLHAERDRLLHDEVYAATVGLGSQVENGLPIDAVVNANGDAYLDGHMKRAMRWWQNNVDELAGSPSDGYRGLERLAIEVNSKVTTSLGRGECAGVTINLPRSLGPDVLVHEMGHAWEHSDNRIGELTEIFWEKRTVTEAARPLNAYGVGYADWEMTKADKFYTPYVGRINGARGGTEILSMGLEAMYRGARTFAKADREHFLFIYDMIRFGPAKVARQMGVAL